jgi:hypothetical protein
VLRTLHSAELYYQGGNVKSLFLLALLVPAMLLGTQRVMVNEEFTGTW